MLYAAFVPYLAAALTASENDAGAIMAKVVEQARKDAQIRHERGMTGIKRQSTSEGDERHHEEWRLEMASDGIRERQIVKDGKPIIGATAERPKIDLVAAMSSRYRLHLAVPVDGYYAIAFEPINPDRPAADNEEAVINHLTGIAYIDAQRFFVRRIHAWLLRPFSINGIGKIQEATVLLDQEMIESVPVPRRTVSEVKFSKFLGIGFNGTRKTEISYEYDPLPIILAPPSP